MAHPLRALALALAIALVALPAPAASPQPTFDPKAGVLSLPLEGAGVPTVFELSHPPRLVLDVPGLQAAPQDLALPTGLAGHLKVLRVSGGSRITLTLRAPARGRWTLRFDEEGRMQLQLPAHRGPWVAVRPPVVSAPRPVATPMATPRPSLRPSSRPTARPSLAPHTPNPSAAPSSPPSARPASPPPPSPTMRPSPSLAPSPRPLVSVAPASPRPTAAPTTGVPSQVPSQEPAATEAGLGTPQTPAKAGPQATIRLGRIDYNEDLRVMVLPLTAPLAARIRSEAAPPRLLLDLPGLGLEAVQRAEHPGALVTQVVAYQLDPNTARVELSLARPIGQSFVLQAPKAVAGGTQLILRFDQKPVEGELEPLVMPSIDLPVRPSAVPTLRPSAAPTPRPSAVPTARPSAAPTTRPSAAPTTRPSAAPTSRPSATPRPTPRPTPRSTPRPTPAPTARPTPAPRPSARPSTAPSPRPSGRPSAAPSTRPTAGAGHPFGGSVYHIGTGEPLGGANVSVGGKRATTDGAGRFQLEGLPGGKLRVEVSAPGFASQSFEVMLPEDRTISLNLVPSL